MRQKGRQGVKRIYKIRQYIKMGFCLIIILFIFTAKERFGVTNKSHFSFYSLWGHFATKNTAKIFSKWP